MLHTLPSKLTYTGLLNILAADCHRLTHIKTLSRAPASLISYEFYDRKVDVFATFQFFYRSQREYIQDGPTNRLL